jgi:ribosomal protein S18/ribosomal protein S6
MQKYELVLMLDASLQEKDRQNTVSALEAEIKDCIIQKDDMGLKKTMHDFGQTKGNHNFYILSYYIQAENKDLDAVKKQLLYNKTVARYFIFKMNSTDEFFTFEALQTKLDKMLEDSDTKKTGQKVSFFMNKENKIYLTWKAIPILKKYMTRFGSIKPRKYTKNPVLVQKKVKECIHRAREIGLLEYIK